MSLIELLNTIANIQPGQTFSTSYKDVISHNWRTGLYRKYYKEDRRETIEFIKDLMEQALSEQLKPEILKALNGLEQLKQTYHGDDITIGQISVLITNIKRKLHDPEYVISIGDLCADTDSEEFFAMIIKKDNQLLSAYLYAGKYPSYINERGQNGLHLLAQKEYYCGKMMDLLIDFNVNISLIDKDDYTPLYYAISTGCVEAILKLEEALARKRITLDIL